MEAVSNTTVLILLSRINRLDLIKNLFTKLFIPPQVKKELEVEGGRYANSRIAIEKELPLFIKVENPKAGIECNIGFGERAAISLANEKKLIFLSDDKKARKVAKLHGLAVLGTLGVLLWNKKNGFIDKKEFLLQLDRLVHEGYYITPELYARAVELSER